MTLRDENGRNDGSVERSKIAVGRTPKRKQDRAGEPWWRVTVYAGDSREEIDVAVAEALRVDAELQERMR